MQGKQQILEFEKLEPVIVEHFYLVRGWKVLMMIIFDFS